MTACSRWARCNRCGAGRKTGTSQSDAAAGKCSTRWSRKTHSCCSMNCGCTRSSWSCKARSCPRPPELEAARERYFDLYDLAPVGYCTVDNHGMILEANLTAAKLLGVTRGALTKLRLTHFMPLAQRQVFDQCCAALDPGGPAQNFELQMVGDDGHALWVHLTANMARDASGVATFRVMFRDVSDRVQLDLALQAKNAELDHARQV